MNARTSFPILIALLFTLSLLSTGCANRDRENSQTQTQTQTQTAQSIHNAYRNGHASEWRTTSYRELEKIKSLPLAQLESMLDAYLTVASKQGVQGLESVLVNLTAELSARGTDGRSALVKRRTALKSLDFGPQENDRPNSYSAVSRPNSAFVQYLPTYLVRSILDVQIRTGRFDPDQALEQDICSEAGLAEFERRWGAERAQQLREMCEGGGSGDSGGVSLGHTSGMSVMDCLLDREPSRAERIQSLMQACMSSVSEGEGNPLADGLLPPGSTFLWGEYPPRQTHRVDQLTDPATGTKISETHYDANNVPIKTYEYGEDGSFDVSYYNELNQTDTKYHYDTEGNLTRGEAYGEGGQLVESVDYKEDGSYEVTRYDEDGNVVFNETFGKDGTSTGGSDPGVDGWGSTPECRAMNLALVSERTQADITSDGVGPAAIINPNPEATSPTETADDLSCLSIAGGPELDDALQCARLAHCPGTAMLGANCGCGGGNSGTWKPKKHCEMTLVCGDGQTPTEVNGMCICNTDAVFVDPWQRGGPFPDPAEIGPGQRGWWTE